MTYFMLPAAVRRRQHSLHSPFPATVRPSQGQGRDFTAVFPRVSGSVWMQLCKSNFHNFVTTWHSSCHLRWRNTCMKILVAFAQAKRKCHPRLCRDLCRGCHNRNITCMPWITKTVMGSQSSEYSAALKGVKLAADWLANPQVLRCRYVSTLVLHSMAFVRAPHTQNQRRHLAQLHVLGLGSHKCRHGIFREKVPG